ncbi:hypothetical protein [Streptomyces sp. NPDC056660]|uniref:hypothetical protein n=1 Tax=Streptomyces sp. NPDC056660 TaxID=3345897 RepID=UPI0036A780EC
MLGRDPLAERPLIAVVHYGNGFNNAWWDGEQLILGDGDGCTGSHRSGRPVPGGSLLHRPLHRGLARHRQSDHPLPVGAGR